MTKIKKIIQQAIKFVGISGIGWILDFCIYNLLGLISTNLMFNNIISSCVGVTFVFIFATRKVFQNNSKISLKWKYVIYLVYQLLLILAASKVLDCINLFIIANISIDFVVKFAAVFSKIIITPFTMLLNFIVMKGLIEKL
jgi:putative flippase GtrA